MTIEYRAVGGSATASEGVLSGLVTPFNTWTTIGDLKRGGFREQIAPGAFAKTLQERDVVLINNHDTGQPMARTSIKEGGGSLSLTEDPSAGLRMRAIPVDTSYARDVMACADAGVTRGMSFGFEAIKDDWTDDDGNPSDSMRGTRRTVREIRLHEATTTAFPAYGTTELSARDAITAARESRAAKATYSDLHTCAECGSKGQYGVYCGDCGKPMGDGDSSDDYCTQCGSKMTGNRSEHVCEKRATSGGCGCCESCGMDADERSIGDDLLDAAANLVTAYNNLPAELRDSLPAEFRTAAECVIRTQTGAGTTTPEGDSEDLRSEARAIAALYGIALA